jgi:hypothetical protein
MSLNERQSCTTSEEWQQPPSQSTQFHPNLSQRFKYGNNIKMGDHKIV